MPSGELNARRARDRTRDVTNQATVVPDHAGCRYRAADVLRERRARRQEDADCNGGEADPLAAGSHRARPFRMVCKNETAELLLYTTIWRVQQRFSLTALAWRRDTSAEPAAPVAVRRAGGILGVSSIYGGSM